MTQSVTWKELVRDVIEKLPRSFSLSDVLAQRDFFAEHYPDNRFIDAKLRLSLRILRDQGVLTSPKTGTFQRTGAEPQLSLQLDSRRVARFTDAAHAGSVTVETWAEHNLYCLSCESAALRRLPLEQFGHFECPVCQARYRIKARGGRFADSVQGPAYETVVRAIQEGLMPDHLLIQVNGDFKRVTLVRAIPGNLVDEERIIPKKGRRSATNGSLIQISGLPHVNVVQSAELDSRAARAKWRAIAGDSLWAMARRIVK